MGPGLQGTARLVMRVLLWIMGAAIVAVIAMLVIMEVGIGRNGGGEMVDSLALLIGLMLIAYYTLVLILGRSILRSGGPRWAWYLVTLVLILVFVPMFLLGRVFS